MLVLIDPRRAGRIAPHQARFSLRPVVPNRVIFDVAPSPSSRPAACAGIRHVVDALTIEGSDAGTGSPDGACDTLNHINYDYALDILRMNTAFIMREVGS